MSIALSHFALGGAMTTLAVTFLVPTVRYVRTAVLFGGGWAMVPDLHWVSPVARGRLRFLHETPVLTDLFWFHWTMDRVDVADSNGVATAMVVFFVAATAAAEYRDYRAPEAVEEAYRTYLDVDPPE